MEALQKGMENMPRHVAIIMDGNGRWAKERGLPRLAGHNAGMQSLKEIVKHSDRLGIACLTVYAFSTENWKRPQSEVSGIFSLLVKYVRQEIDELCANNVHVRMLGDWSVLPRDSKDAIECALSRTADNTGLQFSIAINYGGRAEIVRAASRLAAQAASGELNPEDIDEKLFSVNLYTEGLPDPDLIIRTGGEKRLSNFLIWQSAYSEFVSTQVYWPDFTPQEYEACISTYLKRSRRYGGI